MAAICIALACSGCASRTGPLVDASRLLAEIERRQLASSTGEELTSRFGRLVNLQDGLDLAEAETVALAWSPDLVAARGRADVAAAVASAGAGFPNPTLAVDALGVIGGGATPVRIEASLTFPIPLSDRLGAATSEVSAVYEKAQADVLVAEWRVVEGLREEWVRWMGFERRAALIEGHLAVTDPMLVVAEKLAKAGEIELGAAGLWRVTQVRHRLDAVTARASAQTSKARLVARVGLPASSTVTFQVGLPTMVDPPPSPERHPEVLLALAEVRRAEAQLRHAEAAAVPDISVGPRVDYGEGSTAIGASVSAPLPFFDRNQRAVAEATRLRATAEADVGAALRRARDRLGLARLELAAAQERLALIRAELVPITTSQLARTRELLAAGELDALLLHEILEQVLAVELDALHAEMAAAEAAIPLLPVGRPSAPSSAPEVTP